MCRLIGWVSDEPTTLRQLLGDEAVARLLHLSTVHCHGWGVAWRADDGLRVRRSVTQASDDPDFADVLESVVSTAALVHLRLGTPGLGRQLADTHPFSDGEWALAHNGAFGPIDRVDALLPAEPSLIPQGTTDSERWFLALRHAYDELDATRWSDPTSRVATAAADVVERAESVGLTCSSWNSLLLGPDGLYVVNLHDDSWQPGGIAVWPAQPPDPDRCWPPYFDLRIRERGGERLVVSSGVVDDTAGWTLLPNPSVSHLGFGGRVTTASITARAVVDPV